MSKPKPLPMPVRPKGNKPLPEVPPRPKGSKKPY